MLTYTQSIALVLAMATINFAIVALTVRALRKQAREYRRALIRRNLEVVR